MRPADMPTCILCWWCEVADGVGITAPLCNGCLGGVVGGVVVEVGDGADQAVRVAHSRHTHLHNKDTKLMFHHGFQQMPDIGEQ